LSERLGQHPWRNVLWLYHVVGTYGEMFLDEFVCINSDTHGTISPMEIIQTNLGRSDNGVMLLEDLLHVQQWWY